MGALVARSALSKLKNYAPQFYSFISLGSPHLGTVHRTNILIDSALWFLRTCKGVKCLQQLAFKDSINEKETFLYNLSSEPCKYFTNIINLQFWEISRTSFLSLHLKIHMFLIIPQQLLNEIMKIHLLPK